MKTKKRILLLGILGFSLLSSNILRADTEGNWEKLNNGKWIFIQNEKRVKSNWVDYKENWYYLLSNGEMKENGWEKVNGYWYYFVDGKMLSSQFINYNGDKYYLGDSGAMAVNTKIDGYNIDEEGIAKKLEEHWEQKNNKWFYYGEDGNLYKNKWTKYKGVWYYLLSNGEMKENGWEKVNGCWYYFVDGKMLSSQFINYNGDKYYLGESGAMAVNTKINGYNIDGEGIAKKLEEHWEQKNNKWFYYGEDGNLYKNKWLKYNGVWYYLLSNGEMKENGWEKVNGCWYYFVDGKMLSSQFINYNGDKYYLGESGAMAVNTKINGYNIDGEGIAKKLEEHWEQKNNKWFYYGEDGNLYKNKWLKYNGVWYYLLSNGEMKENGWEKVNGYWYYFVDGKMLSSQFINYNGDKYYLGESGAMAVNTKIDGYNIDGEGIAKKLEEHWEQKNNKWFYYGEDGNLYKNKWIKYNGVWYYLLSNGEMKENGWEKVNGYWYYFVDGKMLSSQFINYNGDKYYLGESGAMAVNTKINGYYIDEEGIAKKLEEHWEQKNNKWFYYGEDGNLYKNKWIKYNGVWYYLLSNGEMKENGWEKVNGYWYYFVDGKMLSSQFINYNGDKYYLGESGAMAVNTKINGYYIDEEGIAKKLEEHWEQKNNKWFYYGEDGNLYKNKWIKYNGVWYYLLSNGEMKENGWEKVNGYWYYFVDGKMLSSQFINYNGDKYYLGESGAMAVNTKINGYNIDENGVARSASKPIGSRSEFIKKVTPGVLKAVKGKGLFPSIAVAQACLETGFGTDGLSPAPIYNLFGIKAADDTPPERYYEIRTAEYDKNGKKYYITDKFMKFSGYDEAFEYYAKLFTRTKWLTNWYRNVVAAKTPEQAAKALTGTYATDPNYGSKLLNIIDTYNLRELDKEIFPNGVKP